jgi:hypothetical protein
MPFYFFVGAIGFAAAGFLMWAFFRRARTREGDRRAAVALWVGSAFALVVWYFCFGYRPSSSPDALREQERRAKERKERIIEEERRWLRESRLRDERALLEFVESRGTVTVAEAATVVGGRVADARALLADLANRDPDRFSVEMDDQGIAHYRFVAVDASK